jgi:hypothetical protein
MTDMVKQFLASRLSGFYFAAMREGEVQAARTIERPVVMSMASMLTICGSILLLLFGMKHRCLGVMLVGHLCTVRIVQNCSCLASPYSQTLRIAHDD